jgi:hypothetical protein
MSVSGNGYTVWIVHTWVLWALPIAIALVSGLIGYGIGHTPKQRQDPPAEKPAKWPLECAVCGNAFTACTCKGGPTPPRRVW